MPSLSKMLRRRIRTEMAYFVSAEFSAILPQSLFVFAIVVVFTVGLLESL